MLYMYMLYFNLISLYRTHIYFYLSFSLPPLHYLMFLHLQIIHHPSLRCCWCDCTNTDVCTSIGMWWFFKTSHTKNVKRAELNLRHYIGMKGWWMVFYTSLCLVILVQIETLSVVDKIFLKSLIIVLICFLWNYTNTTINMIFISTHYIITWWK